MLRKLLRIKAVAEVTGLSRSTIYEMMREGNFPMPVKVGTKSIRFVEDEIASFNAALIAERDNEEAA